MAKLQIIILSLLPFCFGQFSIQGPSDGNRRAQGLKYSADKGVEYTDQAASLGNSGFSIQGASDGNSDFVIQGATDGNSDFRIQGATDGNSEFQIHGPTDGGSQAYVHNYEQQQQQEPQQPVQQGRAIQYKDANGHRVNWRSYNRAAAKPQQQQQQYEEPAPRPVHRRPSHRRPQAQAAAPQPQAAQQERRLQYGSPVANINYNPIDKAPPSIQEILQFQAQIPYVNIIPEHLRHDALEAAQAQAQKFAEEYPKQVLAQHPPQLVIEEAPRSQYRSKPRQHQQREQVRERRQATSYDAYYQERLQAFARQQEQTQAYARPEGQHRREAPHPRPYQQQLHQQAQAYLQQEQQQDQQQYAPAPKAYRRVQQPPAEPVPQYSGNVPSQIQEILRFQAQIPYDVIANQIIYRPDKPYIPQPVQPQQHSEAPQPVPAQYKPQAADYQQQQYEQGSGAVYAQKAHQQQLQDQQQGQLSYAQSRALGYYGQQQQEEAAPRERQY